MELDAGCFSFQQTKKPGSGNPESMNAPSSRYWKHLFHNPQQDIPPAESELIFRQGRIYHIDLTGEEIADYVILVGDPHRVDVFAHYIHPIEVRRKHREFHSCTGYFQGRRLTVLSTGIGTDNIDIVMNELDIAVNYDVREQAFRSPEERRTLTVIRAGTCGSLQDDIHAGDLVVSEWACGMDPLPAFYAWEMNREGRRMARLFQAEFPEIPWVYFVPGNPEVVSWLVQPGKTSDGHPIHAGMTVSAPGFYGPQGRQAGIPIRIPDFPLRLHRFRAMNRRFVNFEMECSAIYLLASLLGWKAGTICVALAGRTAGTFVSDYNRAIERLVQYVLWRLSTLKI